ncbi:MAG: aldehyde dehydrogenase family protein [Vampirovibrionales bacterium]|nr:aldehyde dehydrogenase family protein [Vampirovibrionales bacterium]
MTSARKSTPSSGAAPSFDQLLRPKAEDAPFGNIIGGRWIPARSGRTFENRNPARPDDLIGRFPESDETDAHAAIEAAKAAFDAWRLTPAPRRGEILFRTGEILITHKEAMAQAMTREMGKVLAETRGDVQEAIDMCFYAAGEGRRLYGRTTPSEMPEKACMTVRMPLGVCGLITPWNFPMAIPSWKILPALICGNTVVLKPASDTPLSSLLLVKALEEAGIPPGVVNVVFGSGRSVGQPIIDHSDVRLVSFTGSCEVGRLVNERCAPAFKRVSLEMGGKNAVIIMPDANLDLAVEGIVWGAFGTSGQRCTATSRIIAHREIHHALREKLIAKIKSLTLGDGLQDGVGIGPVVNEAAMKRILEYIAIGKEEGATLLTGGERDTRAGAGWFVQPTLFDNVKTGMRIAQEEIFGPVTALIPVADFDEAVRTANDSDFGLSTAVYTKDVNLAFRALRDLEAGITYINAPTIGAEVHLPFGGVKQTGNGHRDAGETALDVFSEWKSCFIDYSDRLQRAQIDHD